MVIGDFSFGEWFVYFPMYFIYWGFSILEFIGRNLLIIMAGLILLGILGAWKLLKIQ